MTKTNIKDQETRQDVEEILDELTDWTEINNLAEELGKNEIGESKKEDVNNESTNSISEFNDNNIPTIIESAQETEIETPDTTILQEAQTELRASAEPFVPRGNNKSPI